MIASHDDMKIYGGILEGHQTAFAAFLAMYSDGKKTHSRPSTGISWSTV
jgi:hypothetical protein